MKLLSLFDGSGGFPLGAALCGIEPIMASEIEPYPIAVTRSRFPNMKHLGDVSKINGAEIEPVDIITFGSPCQDMSVAGTRSGMKHESKGDDETTRSGLFMEAIRIIKERFFEPAEKKPEETHEIRTETHGVCSDLISRADAIEAMCCDCEGEHYPKCDQKQYCKEVKALLALPSADAVSREDADMLVGLRNFKEYIRGYNNATADAVQGWIPCSERLPSDDEYVIVSVLDDHGDTPWKYTTVAWLCNGVWISDNDILCGTAVAWMPLPKPYREDGEA